MVVTKEEDMGNQLLLSSKKSQSTKTLIIWSIVVDLICLVLILSTFFVPLGQIAGDNTESLFDLWVTLLTDQTAFMSCYLMNWLWETSVIVCLLLEIAILLLNDLLTMREPEKLRMKKMSLLKLVIDIVLMFLPYLIIFYLDKKFSNSFGITHSIIPTLILITIIIEVFFKIIIQKLVRSNSMKELQFVKIKDSGSYVFYRSRFDSCSLLLSIMCFILIFIFCSYPVLFSFISSYGIYPEYAGSLNSDVKNLELGIDYEAEFSQMGYSNYEAKNIDTFYYSSNYNYITEKIEEVEAEINELYKEDLGDLSTSKLAKYLTQMEELKEKKDELNEILKSITYSTMSVRYKSWSEVVDHVGSYTQGTYYYVSYRSIIEVEYNTSNCKSETDKIKWGKAKDYVTHPEGKESITLTKTEFEYGTDYSEEEVGVKITYNDGSLHLYYLSSSTLEQLNGLSKGNQTLKWSDSWGTYEYQVTIV
jgi:hypothetical protein